MTTIKRHTYADLVAAKMIGTDAMDRERRKLGLSWSNYTMLLRQRTEKSARKAVVVPGIDYCDQAGNYIGGQRIPGSAPDDLI